MANCIQVSYTYSEIFSRRVADNYVTTSVINDFVYFSPISLYYFTLILLIYSWQEYIYIHIFPYLLFFAVFILPSCSFYYWFVFFIEWRYCMTDHRPACLGNVKLAFFYACVLFVSDIFCIETHNRYNNIYLQLTMLKV